MLQLENRSNSAVGVLTTQAHVIHALMLRGVRSRFFGNGLGFLAISVGLPMFHVLGLVTLYTLTGRMAPVGDSTVLFFATGLIPYVTFNYVARWTMIGTALDRTLLAFPIVRVLDLLISRVFIEFLGSFLALMCIVVIIWLAGSDPMPRDFVQAAYAYGAAALLGVGVGLFNGIMGLIFRGWLVGYTAMQIPIYISSGIIFVPDSLPERARYFLSFNPVLHAVEWMRSAYYPGYGSLILDKNYLLAWGFCAVFLALVIERHVRGRALNL